MSQNHLQTLNTEETPENFHNKRLITDKNSDNQTYPQFSQSHISLTSDIKNLNHEYITILKGPKKNSFSQFNSWRKQTSYDNFKISSPKNTNIQGNISTKKTHINKPIIFVKNNKLTNTTKKETNSQFQQEINSKKSMYLVAKRIPTFSLDNLLKLDKNHYPNNQNNPLTERNNIAKKMRLKTNQSLLSINRYTNEDIEQPSEENHQNVEKNNYFNTSREMVETNNPLKRTPYQFHRPLSVKNRNKISNDIPSQFKFHHYDKSGIVHTYTPNYKKVLLSPRRNFGVTKNCEDGKVLNLNKDFMAIDQEPVVSTEMLISRLNSRPVSAYRPASSQIKNKSKIRTFQKNTNDEILIEKKIEKEIYIEKISNEIISDKMTYNSITNDQNLEKQNDQTVDKLFFQTDKEFNSILKKDIKEESKKNQNLNFTIANNSFANQKTGKRSNLTKTRFSVVSHFEKEFNKNVLKQQKANPEICPISKHIKLRVSQKKDTPTISMNSAIKSILYKDFRDTMLDKKSNFKVNKYKRENSDDDFDPPEQLNNQLAVGMTQDLEENVINPEEDNYVEGFELENNILDSTIQHSNIIDSEKKIDTPKLTKSLTQYLQQPSIKPKREDRITLNGDQHKTFQKMLTHDHFSRTTRDSKYMLTDLIIGKKRKNIAYTKGLWLNVYSFIKFPKKVIKTENQNTNLILYVNENFLPDKDKFGAFIIFQGNGENGKKINKLVSETLIDSLFQYLDCKGNLEHKMIIEAIETAHRHTKRKMMELCYMDGYKSGCSICMTLIHTNVIYSSNLGSGKAILAHTEVGEECINYRKLQAPQLTCCQDEVKRVLEAGGEIDYRRDHYGDPVSHGKVFMPKDGSKELEITRSLGNFNAHTEGIISDPIIKYEEARPEDKVIIMGNSNFWKEISSKKVVSTIKSLIFRYDEKTINKELYQIYVDSINKNRGKLMQIGLITITQ